MKRILLSVGLVGVIASAGLAWAEGGVDTRVRVNATEDGYEGAAQAFGPRGATSTRVDGGKGWGYVRAESRDQTFGPGSGSSRSFSSAFSLAPKGWHGGVNWTFTLSQDPEKGGGAISWASPGGSHTSVWTHSRPSFGGPPVRFAPPPRFAAPNRFR